VCGLNTLRQALKGWEYFYASDFTLYTVAVLLLSCRLCVVGLCKAWWLQNMVWLSRVTRWIETSTSSHRQGRMQQTLYLQGFCLALLSIDLVDATGHIPARIGLDWEPRTWFREPDISVCEICVLLSICWKALLKDIMKNRCSMADWSAGGRRHRTWATQAAEFGHSGSTNKGTSHVASKWTRFSSTQFVWCDLCYVVVNENSLI